MSWDFSSEEIILEQLERQKTTIRGFVKYSKSLEQQIKALNEIIKIQGEALEFLNTKANFEGKKYFEIDKALEKIKQLNGEQK